MREFRERRGLSNDPDKNKRDLYNIFAIFRNFQTRFRIRKQWHPAREKSQKQACGMMYEQN